MKARHQGNIRWWRRGSGPKLFLPFCLLVAVACAHPMPPATPAEQAKMRLQSGMADYRAGDLANARQNFSEAFQISASVDDRRGVADAKNSLCAVQLQQGKYNIALKECRDAHDIYAALKHTQGMVASLLNIGLIHLKLHDYQKAGHAFTRALETARANQLVTLEAKALNNLGLLRKTNGNMEEARQLYEHSLEINQREKNLPATAVNLSNLGTLYLNAGHPDTAVNYFRRALKIDKNLELAGSIAADLFNLAAAYQAKEVFQTAIDYYERSLEIFEYLAYPRKIAQTRYQIARLDEKTGNPASARENYRAVIRIAESLQMKDLLENARSSLQRLEPSP